MADQGVQIKKRRAFRKYTYRGVDLDQLLAIKSENLVELLGCRARRHFNRGIKRREENFLKRLRAVCNDNYDFILCSVILVEESPDRRSW